jgi:hypothetical protein
MPSRQIRQAAREDPLRESSRRRPSCEPRSTTHPACYHPINRSCQVYFCILAMANVIDHGPGWPQQWRIALQRHLAVYKKSHRQHGYRRGIQDDTSNSHSPFVLSALQYCDCSDHYNSAHGNYKIRYRVHYLIPNGRQHQQKSPEKLPCLPLAIKIAALPYMLPIAGKPRLYLSCSDH